jgi:hypothetical protein
VFSALFAVSAVSSVRPASPTVLHFCYDRSMKTALLLSAAMLLTVPAGLFAAEQTWSGKISDSACGAKHEEAAEGEGVMADRDCTQACIRGGSKYVLVVDGKVFQIANQDNKDLATHAGHAVKMTGELKGNAITVSKIEMP